MAPSRTRNRTEDRPTGRTASCPVCGNDLETVRRHTLDADGRTVAVDLVDRFPAHLIRPNGGRCCESGDPAGTGDFDRAARRTAGRPVETAPKPTPPPEPRLDAEQTHAHAARARAQLAEAVRRGRERSRAPAGPPSPPPPPPPPPTRSNP